MEFDQMIQLIKTVSDSELTQFTFEEGNIVIKMKKDTEPTIFQTLPQGMATSMPQMMPQMMPQIMQQSAVTPQTDVVVETYKVMQSPLVGTFYAAANPESDNFVKVGDVVKKGQTLGIIEAMKLMNEIECEVDGTIVEILVENEQAVEYGQALFHIQD